MKNRRSHIYLEFMRIIACFFVIFNHTGAEGFFLCSRQHMPSFKFWIYLFISIFCKFAVPLFFAISGALLLKKTETISYIIEKRVFRILTILVSFSFLYYLREIYSGRQEIFSIEEFFGRLYSSNWNTAYWYLYAFIPFLISLPFLRVLVKDMENREYYYMFFIALIFEGIIPTVEYLFWKGEIVLNGNARIGWLTNSIVLYPCLGYFLQERVDISNCKKKIMILWIFNIIGILFSCFMTYYKAIITGIFDEGHSQAFFCNFSLINCASIFLTVKYLFVKYNIPSYITRMITSLGSCTFGIYLIHIPILSKVYLLKEDSILGNIQGMSMTFIVCFLTMMISYIIVLFLKGIPVIKKII